MEGGTDCGSEEEEEDLAQKPLERYEREFKHYQKTGQFATYGSPDYKEGLRKWKEEHRRRKKEKKVLGEQDLNMARSTQNSKRGRQTQKPGSNPKKKKKVAKTKQQQRVPQAAARANEKAAARRRNEEDESETEFDEEQEGLADGSNRKGSGSNDMVADSDGLDDEPYSDEEKSDEDEEEEPKKFKSRAKVTDRDRQIAELQKKLAVAQKQNSSKEGSPWWTKKKSKCRIRAFGYRSGRPCYRSGQPCH